MKVKTEPVLDGGKAGLDSEVNAELESTDGGPVKDAISID